MENQILLFDINGVLGTSYPKTDIDSYGYAIRKVFGIDASAYSMDISGMTSKGVFFALLREQVDEKELETKNRELHDLRFGYYKEHAGIQDIATIPGIPVTLKVLHDEGYLMGVLSGVPRDIAEYQLEKMGLNDMFSFGVYGDSYVNRVDMFAEAALSIAEIVGHKVDIEKIFYFDDSLRGILAGKAAGVRTIAVATGANAYEELEAQGPYAILRNLNDADVIVGIVTGRLK
jgi:phosphoglycolate phosphatase-like HAD superfamily hydrolase